jgi:hypothetical protein
VIFVKSETYQSHTNMLNIKEDLGQFVPDVLMVIVNLLGILGIDLHDKSTIQYNHWFTKRRNQLS